MRGFIGMALAGSLVVSSAFAATDVGTNSGPLSPGKAAGVKQADIEAGGVLLILGILGVAAAVAVLATATSKPGPTTSTT